MKRTVVLLTAAAVAATPFAAQAAVKKPTKRVVTWEYAGAFGAYATGVGGGGNCAGAACFELPTTKYEKHISFSAKDATGAKIGIQYYFDGQYKSVPTVCSTASFDVPPGTVVSFDTVVTPGCAGVPTSGTVTITVTGLK